MKNFRQALLVKPEDLTLLSNLGNALLKAEAAQDEFARVLKLDRGISKHYWERRRSVSK